MNKSLTTLLTLAVTTLACAAQTIIATNSPAFSNSGTVTNNGGGGWHYYRVEATTNLPGWRVVLSSSSGADPDVYVRRGQVPTTSSYDKRSTGQAVDTLTFTEAEATSGTLFVGVYLPGSTASTSGYTLSGEVGFEKVIAWDSGTTHEGTQVFTNTSPTGGDYYFKITTQTGASGAWRTALKVQSGEADVFLKQGAFGLYPSGYNKVSTRVGSDGMVLAGTTEYTVGQEWHIMVRATPGAQWTLVSGEAYVLNLGNLAPSGSTATSTNVTIGPEGMRLFKVTVPIGTLAWRLGLNGAANDLLVRKGVAPTAYSGSTYDQKETGRMLLVPNYLVGGDSYFVGVPGAPGSAVNLDNRQQTVTDLAFAGTTSLSVSGYGFTTYRVQVPVQQIAWLTTLTTTAGEADFAVRRGAVPNRWNNDAFSEVSGLGVESVMMVPPTLSDGTFYVTVYGAGAHTFTLDNGNPVITDILFSSTTTNTDVSRAGWRVYRVLDITNQLGALGWDLLLSNQPPGTDIALRRNAVPGKWNYRNGSTSVSSQGSWDTYSTGGFLQRAEHEADIWYVGVYNPATALGPFVLSMREISTSAQDLALGNGTVTNQPVNRFAYFRLEVPADALGWELRLTNVTSGDPRLSVRRDLLPDNLTSHNATGAGWSPGSTWPTGCQWVPGDDWSDYSKGPNGTNISGQLLSAGRGYPLEPGVYYVGVLGATGSSQPLAYTLVSRLIGATPGIPVQPLPLSGSVTNNALTWGNAEYYSVNVPPNTPSWRIKLDTTLGDALLIVSKDVIPSITAAANSSAVVPSAGRRLQKIGDELFVLMPASGQEFLTSGTYYLSVVSEGQNPSASLDRYGSNFCSYVLSNLGPLSPQNLGTVGGSDLVHSGSAEPGELKAYQFSVPAGLMGLEVRLENPTGSPKMSLRYGTQLVASSTTYGASGGQPSTSDHASLIYLPNPPAGTVTLMVHATDLAVTSNAQFTLRLRPVTAGTLAFQNGSVNVTAQPVDSWRYFRITVPADASGWTLRLANVTSGDPRMVICRSNAPVNLSSVTASGSSWGPVGVSIWPTGYQWAPGTDWTEYSQSPSGANESGHWFTVGMGNPLEPGDYVVGVYRGSGNTVDPLSYTLESDGIGVGYATGITNAPFAGSIGIPAQQAREASFFRISVPTNATSWKLRLQNLTGESRFAVQRGTLPNIDAASSRNPTTVSGGRLISKPGDETLAVLPASGQTNIPSGDYYIAVISEGQGGSGNKIGTNGSAATLHSLGEISVPHIGGLSTQADLELADSIPGGEFKAYRFTVPPGILSMDVRLTNTTGAPYFTMRLEGGIPSPNQAIGYYGGQSAQWSGDSSITIPNPIPGEYWLTVQAKSSGGVYPDADFTFRAHAFGAIPITFDGGTVFSATNQPSDVPQYFYVTVPANALGWDLRLTNVTSGDPRLVVRREQLPTSLSTANSGGASWNAGSSTSWPAGYQWAPGTDWTGYSQNANGGNESGHVLATGMGRPLEPGNYYIGVLKGTGSANPMSYTLVSRGIGPGFAIPVTPIAFGGTANQPALAVREAAYYSVEVPVATPSWKLRLSSAVGESSLIINKDYLPNITAGSSSPAAAQAGRLIQKTGTEHFALLPASGTNSIPPGTYYVAVMSEGQNPVPSRSGSNTVSFAFSDLGQVQIDDLGLLGGTDLIRDHSLEGGELRAYRFSLPAGVPGIEVWLENRIGNPRFAMRTGSGIPRPLDTYGWSGGESHTWEQGVLQTLVNPVATNYTLSIFADEISSTYLNASYRLRVKRTPVSELNFSATFNTNGNSNIAAGALADGQRAFHRVVVPATLNGQPVLGWKLALTQTSGAATLRARKDLLPSDSDSNGMPFTSGEAVIVPPFLTAGTWYVEVKAAGGTTYSLSSEAAIIERPAWGMQAEGQPASTPGLTAPDFADTGVQTDGTTLPGDGGTDLEQGRFHYYSVVVPTNNSGIMRVVLEAISGNPDYYFRADGLPTLSHNASGQSGVIHDRSLTDTGTEYANWVGLAGRYERGLPAGTNYIGIRASGSSNARYRLRLSTGLIQDLALHGGSAMGQTLTRNDFRYFRVLVPSNAPTAWNVTFSEIVGNVIMYVRDTLPPGHGTSLSKFIDWDIDDKNHSGYPSYDVAGTHTITTPPLRPGHTYYLGFRGVTDASFDISTSTNGVPIGFNQNIAFYGGYVTNLLPAFGSAEYRITAPADARRWKHSTTGNTAVQFYLEQGSVPTRTSSDHWTGNGISTNTAIMTGATPWPWIPDQSYFLLVTNTSALAQGYSFRMDGRNCATDDEDRDGMLDCWELSFFPNLSATATQDADGDGNNNLLEYQDGTSPIDGTSMLARLTVITNGSGAVSASPLASSYSYGTPVTLTATPAANHVFAGWSGPGVSSQSNPLIVQMTTNRFLTANFSYNYGQPGMVRADYRFQNTLDSSVGTPPPLTYINSGQYFTNITAEGDSRTVLRFPVGGGLQLQPTTTVFPSNAYSIVLLFRFDTVAGWRRLIDTKTGSPDAGLYVHDGKLRIYPASAESGICITNDVWHQVVLTRDALGTIKLYSDGILRLNYNDATTAYLTLNAAASMRFFKDNSTEDSSGYVARIRNYATALSEGEVAALERFQGGQQFVLTSLGTVGGVFSFNITGPAGPACVVERSTNLVQWAGFSNISSFPGVLTISRTAAPAQEFFRTRSP